MPSSHADLLAKREASWPCTVFRMRAEGIRLPAAAVAHLTPVSGHLVCQELGPGWAATVYGPDMRQELLFIAEVQLLREGDGVRLYQGLERDAGGRPRWKQTWLCTSAARGFQILRQMAEQEAAQ